jgi:HSP20 family protein
MMSAMRDRLAGPLSSEVADFSEEIRRVFQEFGQAFGVEPIAGPCSPPLDVYEQNDVIEIVVDVPGVQANALRIIAKGDAVLVVGDKAARRPRPDSSFHLVERDFGRFARAVRLAQPCEMSKARARLTRGELRITLPKMRDRRARTIEIPLTTDPPDPDA